MGTLSAGCLVTTLTEAPTSNTLFISYLYCHLGNHIGRIVSSPFKPLYKPTLTDFEKAVVDIENRVEHIEYTVVNISLEEQRQTNWFKVERKNEKKTILIRYLLHSDEEFDEDDFSNAIPLMVKFLSRYTLDELQEIYQKRREHFIMSKFNARSISSYDSSSNNSNDSDTSKNSDEEQYEDVEDDTDGNSLNSWTDFEQPTYRLIDEIPKTFRSLDSIKEERESSETGSINTEIHYHPLTSLHSQTQASRFLSTSYVGSRNIDDVTATARSRTSSLSDVYVEISEMYENLAEEETASVQNTKL